MNGNTRLGVVGCGGFGLFALQQFAQVAGVSLTAMAGTQRDAARAAALRFGIPDIQDVDQLVNRDDVDLVYIATPPFLHYPQAMQALKAGKHVICEKPLALTVAQAEELVQVARQSDLLLIANLMQRYNPLYDKVLQLIQAKVLGEFLHGYFENYASDENLGDGHWFWDREKSGGIFIEHGVHFFDMVQGWFGTGIVESAQAVDRATGEIEDQVQCAVRYGDALVNFYHGFHQPGRMDRQEFRLVFEKGDVTLEEWVPSRAVIRAVVDEADTRKLSELFPGCRIDVLNGYGGEERRTRGHGKALNVYQKLELHWGQGQSKMPLYCSLLRKMLADQTAWLQDRTHERVITDQNGLDSIKMACRTDELVRRA